MMNLVLDNPNFGTKEEIFKKTTEVLDKLFIKKGNAHSPGWMGGWAAGGGNGMPANNN